MVTILKNTSVSFNINGITYTRTTNEYGSAKLNINLMAGEYISTAYNSVTGEMRSNNITVLSRFSENADLVKYYRNDSQYIIRVIGEDGNPVGAGEDVTFNINGVFYTRSTDESGYALSCHLKYGTYLVRETTVPEGYFGVADFLVTIDENSTTAKTFTLVDESFKAYLKVVKMDALSGKSILDNPATFKIYDYDLKEYVSFDIPTEDGSIKTVDEFKTNESGELITSEPLLPGKYRIEETVCPEGYYGLFTCDIEIAHTGEYETYVTEDGTVTNMGIFTVSAENNPVPSIKTTAKDSVTGTNVGTVGKAVSIIDTVYYVGLIPGKEYTLKGIVMNTETGEPFLQDGKEVTAELDFKAATSAGSVDLKFEIDSTELHGKSVTVFETLYDGEIAIAVHADIEDKDQTITFPPEEVPPVETPPTGDNFPVVSLIILMCAAVVGIVFVIKKRD